MAKKSGGKDSSATKIYKKFKKGVSKFEEEVHCPMIIDVMSNSIKGTVSAFCVKAQISDSTFYHWCNRHKIFNECYRYGVMKSRENWEDEGRQNSNFEDWHFEYWRMIGWSRFGVGKNSRIRLNLNKEGTPNDHYTQLITQASNGDFTAGEIKQLMEAINIGLRSHEVFELQRQINELVTDQAKLEKASHGNNIGSNKTVAGKD